MAARVIALAFVLLLGNAASVRVEVEVSDKVLEIPSPKLLEGFHIVQTLAETNEMKTKMMVAQTATAVIEARSMMEEAKVAAAVILTKDKTHEDMLKALEAAIKAANEMETEAEAEGEQKKSEAETKLASVQTDVKAAQKEVTKFERYLKTAETQGAESIATAEAQLKEAMKRILSAKNDIARKKNQVQGAKDAFAQVLEKQKQQTAHTEAVVQQAMDDLATVQDDTDAAIDAARRAKETAEQEYIAAKTSLGGKVLVSGLADKMLQEAAQAQKKAEDEYAIALQLRDQTKEWQLKVNEFYESLTTVESQFNRRLFPKLEAESVSASDATVAKWIANVDTEKTTLLATNIYANEAELVILGGLITAVIPEMSAHIKPSLDEIQAKTIERISPLCKWYVLAVKGESSAGADACVTLKADVGPSER